MQAVLQSFFATEIFEECRIDIVYRGGDADTTGARYGTVSISRRWLKAVDEKISAQCTKQATALLALNESATSQATGPM